MAKPGHTRGGSTKLSTLPDYLKPGLDVVLVGINPGEYSARVGHYFATPRNRFWAAVNRSGLLGEELSPETDARVLEYGVGLTDVVKRPTKGASGIRAADYREWAPVLREKMERYRPLIVCFQGIVGYRNYLKYVENADLRPELGPQDRQIGGSKVFLLPNPSPANAAYSLDDLTEWFRKLKFFRDALKKS